MRLGVKLNPAALGGWQERTHLGMGGAFRSPFPGHLSAVLISTVTLHRSVNTHWVIDFIREGLFRETQQSPVLK